MKNITDSYLFNDRYQTLTISQKVNKSMHVPVVKNCMILISETIGWLLRIESWHNNDHETLRMKKQISIS